MIKTWQGRCEEHPGHNGIVTDGMIQARMQEEIDDLRTANEAFGKRQEWWNNRMFEMESELQRYKKSAAMWRNKAYEASGHPLPWEPDELWQGLTDEEMDEMRQESKLDFVTLREFRVVARTVEEKLKEKNG